MSFKISCDDCNQTIFTGKKTFCEECFTREQRLKQRYEKELEAQLQEIASLKAKLDRKNK